MKNGDLDRGILCGHLLNMIFNMHEKYPIKGAFIKFSHLFFFRLLKPSAPKIVGQGF